MEQTLLPPSQTRLSCFSVDSRFADQYYAGTADFLIRLPSKMQNVMRIALNSVEIPQVAYVFSAAAGNTGFSVGGTSHDISEGNYTAVQLAAAVSAVSGLDCSYNSITNRFGFINTTGSVFNLYMAGGLPTSCVVTPTVAGLSRYWGLGYNMGFRPSPVVTLGSHTTLWATESPQITAPPYMLLQLRCPDMMENTLHRLGSGSYVQALAKLVLRQGVYQINTDDLGNLLRKENVFKQPTSITQFRISLVDAWGNLVDMGDTDWSVSFEIMEVVSSCEYAALNSAYGRC